MSGPFKMKGSPMQRNFGIGASPMKEDAGDIIEGFKVIGKTLTPSIKNIKKAGSDIKEGFRQLFTGDRTDSRNKKVEKK